MTSYYSGSINSEVQQQLSAGEQMLWSGQPKSGIQLRTSDIFLIPFSLFWAGFAVFWESSVIGIGAPFFFMLWGIPFILMGLYITVGRFFLDAALRAKTWYAVTNERILIVSGLINQTIRSYPLRSMPEMTLRLRRDQSGTITFGAEAPSRSMYRGFVWPGMDQRLAPAFDLLPDAQSVYDLIRRAQRAAV